MEDPVLLDTRIQVPAEAEWRPLGAVARLSRANDELPSFAEYDFMYIATVVSRHDALRIHLYKHRETRRYLNLDDGGHAYQYCGLAPGDEADSGGRYRLHRSLAAALLAAVAADVAGA